MYRFFEQKTSHCYGNTVVKAVGVFLTIFIFILFYFILLFCHTQPASQAGLGSQILLQGSVRCRLWTIVFSVRKRWDFCCHVLICMVKTIVCSLRFTLTNFVSQQQKNTELAGFLAPECREIFPNITVKEEKVFSHQCLLV